MGREGPADGGRVPVVAAVVRRDGRYLVAKRPAHKRHGGRWEFPGGKLLDGESDREGLERELGEELGVSVVAVDEPLFTAPDPGSRFEIRFVPARIRGEPDAREHDELCWADPGRLGALDLAPGDARFVEACLSDHDATPESGGSEMTDRDTASPPTTPPQRRGPRRYPGWLLIPLGALTGAAVSGWWGGAFGAAVGFFAWRMRA